MSSNKKWYSRHTELVKNIIIIVLIFSAFFLGWESRLFGNSSVDISDFIDDKAAVTGGSQELGETIGQAKPIGAAVTGRTGEHYGAKYSRDDMNQVYNNSVQIFRAVLGSAQTPDSVDEQGWRVALTSPGIYFEYMTPIRLSVLSGWFDAEITAEWSRMSTRRLCAVTVYGKNRLYFQDDSTGRFYAADTADKSDSITKLTDSFGTNNAAFAFEILGKQELKDPYALLVPNSAAHPLIVVKNPLQDNTAQILQELGVSEHQKSNYTDSEGAQVYIETDYTLRVQTNGTVKWTSDKDLPSVLPDENDAVETARLAVASSIGRYAGEADIYLDSVQKDGSSYHIMFKYILAGGQIYLNPDGYAAVITMTDGIITEMELHYRNYAVLTETVKLLPEAQAAAAAGGAFMLCYIDDGSETLLPSWIVIPPAI